MTMQNPANGDGSSRRKAIAVIGSGAAALGAAWVLAPHHDVTLFEKNDYPGGHAHTVDVTGPNGQKIAVDTGFIVYNEINYPNLVRLFKFIGIETQPTDMGFAVSLRGGQTEYSGGSLGGLLAQKSNLLKPRFLFMIRDILRFYKEAPALLKEGQNEGPSLGDYLAENNYGAGFIEDHILPMAAAIWSAPAKTLMAFPIISFVRFFQNHGLLSVNDRPQWRTVVGGSRRYVETLIKDLRGRVHLSDAVQSVERHDKGVVIATAAGRKWAFDEVVFGSHADETLAMLAEPTPEEKSVLGAFRFEANTAWLHGDENFMPKRRNTWSAWNYLGETNAGGAQKLAVSYWMNKLQTLDPAVPLFITLNPPTAPDPAKTYGRYDYDHPIFDHAALAAQNRLFALQGQNHSWFCGAWTGYGFHEDGFSSGLRVAAGLGCLPPWTELMISVA
jgi:predicted NAD/FAD-binding protein